MYCWYKHYFFNFSNYKYLFTSSSCTTYRGGTTSTLASLTLAYYILQTTSWARNAAKMRRAPIWRNLGWQNCKPRSDRLYCAVDWRYILTHKVLFYLAQRVEFLLF